MSTTDDVMGTAATVVPMTPSEPPGVPDVLVGDQRARRLAPGRLGWIFAAIWLVYLVPVVQAALGRPSSVDRIVGVAAVVGFGVAYVLSFMGVRQWRRSGLVVPTPLRVGVLGLSVALFVVTAVTVGEQSLAMLVFVAVQVVFVLPRRAGLVGAAVCVVAAEALVHVPGWSSMEGAGFSVALASIAMWGVTGMIERNVELARAQATIAEMAVQTERARFARDLHDILGHSLTVLTVKAELAGRLVEIDPERAGQEIAEVEQLARQALADVRAAVTGYREATLPRELASARVALEAAGIVAELPGAVDDVPPERRELLAWAVREGVTNVVRHSKAAHAWVRLDRDGVEVADDGVGPDAGDAPPLGQEGGGRSRGAAHGLVGLRERAAPAGARVVIGRRDGGGFVLRVGW
jgi:two-component system, NarL family, sensor histidine kinase DesK